MLRVQVPSATLRQAQGLLSLRFNMTWYTYILLCDEKIFYVGLTSNLENRLESHLNKYNIGTKKFSHIELVYSEQYPSRKLAENREIQLKKWSVAKKKALIEGNINLLKQLSKSRD